MTSTETKQTAIASARNTRLEILHADQRESLVAWFHLYMTLEAGAGSPNTFKAKQRDVEMFLSFFSHTTRSDHPDQWTRSITGAFGRHLQQTGKKATSINRIQATLRHSAAWIHRQRPFLAGNPFDRVGDLQLDDPEWKGLSDLEITRLKSAAEQMLKIKTAKNHLPLRDYALFLVLLNTGLRVSELLSVEISQYDGKHLKEVRRKGRKVSRSVFLPKDAREALDNYLEETRGSESGPLFSTKNGPALTRQNAHIVLKAIAAQANARLPAEEKIHLSAHVLRHTMLRRIAEEHGLAYAMELSGHTSSQYIWRYVKPTDEQKEKALENLF
jgi:integrase/recombinase XerD